MASQIKYLSLDGLARVVAQIRANFGAQLSYSPNTDNGIIKLLDDVIHENTSTYGVLSTITIPSASTSQAGLMTTAQVTELNRLTSEEITEIIAGNGLTGGGKKDTVTLHVGAGTGISVADDAVNLKTATNGEIGGIKTGYTTNGKNYPVELTPTGQAYVNVPWENTTSFTINATASDDRVVILTGTRGTNAVSYRAAHAKKLGDGKSYDSNNTTTRISGSGASGTIQIPQLTVDEYGHVTAAEDEAVTITMPTIPTTLKSPNALLITVGNKAAVSYDGGKEINVVITPETIGIPNVMQYVGQTASTQTLADASATATITLTTGSHTATRGDVVIDYSNQREYIWNGSSWELLGTDDISRYKTKQTAVTSPTASSTDIAFIDTISQDTNGVIKATKKTVRNASTSQSGVVTIGSNISVSNGKISVPIAATNALGVVKPGTTNGKTYGVDVDANGAMTVNVPWTDNNTTSFIIKANAYDDDVVILTGTPGTNAVTYSASHAKQGPSGGFDGTPTETSQSPAHGTTATLNIPDINVNEYGHVTSITNQAVKITMPSHTDHTIQKGTETNCAISITNSGSTSTIGVTVPTAAANALGVVKGWHYTSGTATGSRIRNATNAPSINARTTSSDRYYGVETDSTGAMFVNVPWKNDDTHHQAKIVLTSSSTSTTAAAATNPYLNLVENNTVRSSQQIVGAGGTTVSSDATGKITITSETHVAITNGEIDTLFA